MLEEFMRVCKGLCWFVSLTFVMVSANAEQNLEEFLEHGWDFEIGETLEDIVKRFGKPLQLERREIRNRHNSDQIDEIYKLRYHGLRIAKYRVNSTKGKLYELMLAVTITSSKYQVKHGLNVSSSIQSVKRILGKPAAENGSSLRYEAAEGGATVTFHVAGGKVRKIEWSFHPD
jgi:hypothetical protein